MSGTVGVLYLRPTLIAGSIRELGAGSAPASSATKATYANAGTGIRQFNPEASSSAVATIPTDGSAPRNIGWRMVPPIQNAGATANPADPVEYAAQTWNVSLLTSSDTNAVAGTLTAIVYVGGVERGRLTSGLITFGGAATSQVLAVPIAAFTSDADAKIQVEAYVEVTVGGVNLNGVNITLHNGSSQSTINANGTFIVRSTRTTSDTITQTDTAQRTTTTSRTTLDTGVTTDTARRVASVVRTVLDAIAVPVDSASRVITFARLGAEILAAIAESATRVLSYIRRPSETTTQIETARRVINLSITAVDYVTMTAVASKSITYLRVTRDQFAPTDDPPSNQIKQVAGVVYNNDGTPYLGGATVILIREDGVVVQTATSSTVNGSYNFPRNFLDTHSYTVAAHTSISGSPYQAVTPRALAPV